MRRAARIDSTHTEIVKALREIGASVQSLATIGQGCPDILVGWRGENHVLEIKGPHGGLTPDEWIWHQKWSGEVQVVRNVDEALAAIGAV